ncbi:MAG: tryptophan-rich sensory protein [Ekhidna sp.]
MKRIYPIAALVLVLTVNFLANYLPIGGRSTSAISDAYISLFTPAGFTFSIWGIIYLFLIGYIIYQVLPQNRSNELLDKINPLFIVNCVANAAWIFTWHYDLLPLSLIVMSLILITLILIYRKIASSNSNSTWNTLFVYTPFSLYVGWITVATIANISIIQAAYGWNDVWLSEPEWTIIKLGLAGAIGAAMVLQQNNKVFGLVVAWASYGIFKNQMNASEIVGGAAGVVLVLILTTIVIDEINKLITGKS